MKKIFNSLFALALLLVQIVPTTMVSATKGTNSNDGVITINDAVTSKTYSVYQILQLESYDTEKSAYTYKLMDSSNKWNAFFNQDTIKNVYVTIDDENIVEWIDGKDAKTFTELALAYAKANNISATQSQEADSTTVQFTGLNLGYYLVDSSLGALLGLTTTKPSAAIKEKNSVPTVEKKVQENTTGNYGDSNTDYIGATINFETTIKVENAGSEELTGAQNYVLYDIMSSGLTLNKDSIVVTLNDNKTLTVTTDYTVSFDTVKDNTTYTFVIDFTDSFEKTLKTTDVIKVTYNALLNKNAQVGTEGNPNQTHLEYGEENKIHKTPTDTTKTYTYSFDLVKTDSSDIVIEGAEFKLYHMVLNQETGKNEKVYINLIKDTINNKEVYRPVIGTETGETIKVGQATIIGLDNDTYYLEETKAPEGYNKLVEDTEVVINGTNLDATTTTTQTPVEGTDETVTTITYVDGGIQVINLTGAELPETGGIGTMLFVTIGSLLVLGFGVLLVTKLRMSKMVA